MLPRPARALTTCVALLLAGSFALGTAAAQPTSTTTPTPFTSPNTDSCPNKLTPPPPIDESEVPLPGQTSPVPLPVPAEPVGGPELGDCGIVKPKNASALPEEISATSWAVFDLDTGQVLAAKDPHGRYRPASTIKTLLAIVALKELSLSTVVTGTQADADVDGTKAGIGPRGRYTVDQLMHALIMMSANDAANAIARQLGGIEATLDKMNAEAKALGALDTRAATPSGLDGPGMSTSAYDLAAIFAAAMKLPKFAALIHTEQVDFPGFPIDPTTETETGPNGSTTTTVVTSKPGFPIGNDNHLLYNYEGALGGKTGFTDDARQTFVAGAERNGRRLGVTLLKADVLPIRPWEQAARLLDWGFAQRKTAEVGTLNNAIAVANGVTEGTTAAVSTAQQVALAKPPVNVSNDRSTAESSLFKVLIVAGGILIIVVLLLAAGRLQRRHR